MKVRVKDIKKVIREELLHGVPEWQLREDTARFVEQVRDRITAYIRINKSGSSLESEDAITAMNEVCDGLEDKVYAVVEDQLLGFVRRV